MFHYPCTLIWVHVFFAGLSHEQVDILWQCLAQDPECADELFGWLLNQAKSKDQHALSVSLFKHVLLEKVNIFFPYLKGIFLEMFLIKLNERQKL